MNTLDSGKYFKIEMFDGEFDIIDLNDETMEDQEEIYKKHRIKIMVIINISYLYKCALVIFYTIYLRLTKI